MKKIMLHAYCADNLGDDLFIRYLCRRFPDTGFHLQIEGAFGKALSDIPNLTVHRTGRIGPGLDKLTGRWVSRERLVGKCDGLIHIGGSIFIQNRDWQSKYARYSRLLSRAKKARIIGANFGPYDSEEYKKAYQSLFREKAESVCFRDSYSYRQFADSPNMSWAPDILFAPDYMPYITEENRAVLSVMDQGEDYLNKMAETGDYLAGAGYEVVLMSFCSREKDPSACLAVRERMNAPCRLYTYTGNIEEALRLLGGASLIVATRFHSMVLGWAMGKKVFPVVYSEKMRHVIEDLSPDAPYASVQDVTGLTARQIAEGARALGKLAEIKERAGKHIESVRGLVQ